MLVTICSIVQTLFVLGERCIKNIFDNFVSVALFLLNKTNNNNGCGRYFINLNFELRHGTDTIKKLYANFCL